MNWRPWWLALFVGILLFRLCHSNILWVEEAYGGAAAAEILSGKMLYRDVWFDKPPLYAAAYLLSRSGSLLRILGAAYVWLCSWLAFRLAHEWWGEREGWTAALLLAFYLTFGIPSAVMALTPDLLLIAPHLLTIFLASRGRAFASGVAAGVGLLFNTKALFILAVVMLWRWRAAWRVLTGFLLPQVLILPVAEDYWNQVWRWGSFYAADSFIRQPFAEALKRTLNWAGFHAAIVLPAIWQMWKERDWRNSFWSGASAASVAAGLRFFPRYYFQLLPATAVLGARGLRLLSPAVRIGVLSLLLIPALRFGPRYVRLAADQLAGRPHQWIDLALEQDSRDVAAQLRPSGTLLVWGYRPDIYVFSHLRAATPWLDSQPLTGVMADRHLTSSAPTVPEWAYHNRQQLISYRPSFIVDALAIPNPALAITRYPDLNDWLRNYTEAGRTKFSIIYRLTAAPNRASLTQER